MHQLQFGTKKNARGIAACENKNKTKQKIIRQEWPLLTTPADARSLVRCCDLRDDGSHWRHG